MSFIGKILERKAVKDVSWVYAGAVNNGLSLFLVNIILGRALSTESYGAFSLAILVLSTVAELSDFGLNAGVLRFAPYYIAEGEEDKLKQLLKTVWRWRVALTLILTLGGVATAPLVASSVFGEPAVYPYLAYAYLGVGGVILLGFVGTYLQAARRFRYQAILQFFKGSLRLLGVAVLFFVGSINIFYYLSVYIFVPWALFAFGFGALPKRFTQAQIPDEQKKNIHRQLKNFSFWLVVWSLMSIVAARVDQAMISKFLGLEQVAVYAIAYQFIQFFPVLTQSIASVLTPRINSLKTKAEIADFIKRTLWWLVPLALGVAILIYPSQWLILLFFGQKYAAAMPVYLVLSYSISLNILVTSISLAVTAFNQTRLVALSGVIQLLVNIAANVSLIPKFGVMGAAYAFGLGIFVSVVYNVGCVYYLLKRGDFKIS